MTMSTETATAAASPLPARCSGCLTFGLWGLVGLGVVTFLIGIAGEHAQRAWQAYLVNWLFWSGLALSGLTFTALLQITKAEWAGQLRQLAEALGAFLPVSFFLLILLFVGSEQLFPWILEPVPAKQVWLNKPFLIIRNLLGVSVLYGCGLALLHAALRAHGSLATQQTSGWLYSVIAAFSSQEKAKDTEAGTRTLTVLSPIFIFLYAILFSLIAFDLVMSLEPHWLSTLFGLYFCIGNLYAGLGALAVIAVIARSSFGLPALFPPERAHDLGKLIFGFCILWTYLFWCQYLTIWYGNLPEETGFLLVRLHKEPWTDISFVVLLLTFLTPFPLLLLQWVKRTPAVLAVVSLIIVVGMWLERYILVVPSIWHEHSLPLGWIELGVLVGFFALFTLAFLTFMRAFPLATPPTAEL